MFPVGARFAPVTTGVFSMVSKQQAEFKFWDWLLGGGVGSTGTKG